MNGLSLFEVLVAKLFLCGSWVLFYICVAYDAYEVAEIQHDTLNFDVFPNYSSHQSFHTPSYQRYCVVSSFVPPHAEALRGELWRVLQQYPRPATATTAATVAAATQSTVASMPVVNASADAGVDVPTTAGPAVAVAAVLDLTDDASDVAGASGGSEMSQAQAKGVEVQASTANNVAQICAVLPSISEIRAAGCSNSSNGSSTSSSSSSSSSLSGNASSSSSGCGEVGSGGASGLPTQELLLTKNGLTLTTSSASYSTTGPTAHQSSTSSQPQQPVTVLPSLPPRPATAVPAIPPPPPPPQPATKTSPGPYKPPLPGTSKYAQHAAAQVLQAAQLLALHTSIALQDLPVVDWTVVPPYDPRRPLTPSEFSVCAELAFSVKEAGVPAPRPVVFAEAVQTMLKIQNNPKDVASVPVRRAPAYAAAAANRAITINDSFTTMAAAMRNEGPPPMQFTTSVANTMRTATSTNSITSGGVITDPGAMQTSSVASSSAPLPVSLVPPPPPGMGGVIGVVSAATALAMSTASSATTAPALGAVQRVVGLPPSIAAATGAGSVSFVVKVPTVPTLLHGGKVLNASNLGSSSGGSTSTRRSLSSAASTVSSSSAVSSSSSSAAGAALAQSAASAESVAMEDDEEMDPEDLSSSQSAPPLAKPNLIFPPEPTHNGPLLTHTPDDLKDNPKSQAIKAAMDFYFQPAQGREGKKEKWSKDKAGKDENKDDKDENKDEKDKANYELSVTVLAEKFKLHMPRLKSVMKE